MKNSTRLRMALIFFVFINYQAIAQNNDAATYFAKFITAQKYLKGDGLPKDILKALNLYTDCAENGKMPFAMNQLGIMYQTGKGITKDPEKALYWFSKSTEKGDPIGMYHLGAMYKTGEGVTQDFSKAYDYFKSSAEKGYYGGMYCAGYCKFKGLGTIQSYSEAVEWFRKGVEQDCPASQLMLGICYRNGYGVEQNETEAINLLKKAAEKKISAAGKELKMIDPEIAGNKSNQEKDPSKPEKFKKLLKNQSNISLTGTWTGTRYFFDWSGQHIIREDSLIVTMKQTGSKIKGQWFENNKLVVELNGTLLDEQIIFNDSEFIGSGRLGESYPMQFKVARFEAINDDKNHLAGNIESYSPYTKEPGYPCYVTISRLQNKSAKTDTIKTEVLAKIEVEKTPSDIQKEELVINNENTPKEVVTKKESLISLENKNSVMTAYPNPFTNEINITYKNWNNNDISLYVYNTNGSLILQKALGTKPAGTYTEKVILTAISGQYIVKMIIGTEAYTQIIIKK